ncbi:MAG: bifunctional 4-hydroxy-2-oxoglutarate aldolase/2-dehydro-3-deoxy-phosphogluconate aldolase [Desulfobacteraceae bacterium]|nr:MAG: bifunctional 4-hydroxy-2-oxoglutarate aldolase/2-dehydro-3-deoxy-phosphogluconate aldolase [Desulfobacteraceae bacterium]
MHTKRQIAGKIAECGLIPVIRTSAAAQAMEVADALQKGGAPVIEITMTVPGALDVFEELSRSVSENVILGAGTVLDGETARLAILAGAQFVVAPTLDKKTIEVCHRYGKVVIPGALTPTEILRAWEMGADFVKVFPADALGGPGYIKAVKAPLPQVDLIPTGGVDIRTAPEFIRAGAAAVGAGSSLIDKKILKEGTYDRLVQMTKDFLKAIKEARS